MTATAIAPPTTEQAEPEFTTPLTAHDRCDACSAQAYVVWTKDGIKQPLMFCGHHSNEHETELFGKGWNAVHDERGKLQVQESKQRDAGSAV